MRSPKAQKSNKIKKKELQAKRKQALLQERAVRQTPPAIYLITAKVRNLPNAIEAAFSGNQFPYSERKIHNIIEAAKDHPNRPFLKRIFLHFAKFKIDFADKKPSYHPDQGTNPIDVLRNLAYFESDAIRSVEEWKPSSHNLYRQIFSFARHLYAKYSIPSFMDTAWYGVGRFASWQIYGPWFIQIGQGHNLRTMNGLPVSLTKKEAHFVMQAPKDFTIPQAIRYGQILNLGGNEPFVRQVLRTRIAVDFNRHDFWMSVFRWLLQHPMLDVAHYAPIVDFIYNQKFVPCRLDTNGHMVCAQPNMSMKNRDPESLLKQVEIWHKQIGKEKRGHFDQWAASGIKGYYHKNDTNKVVYMIQEICTQKELVAEGRTMRHCAGSYAGSCAQGRISIWKFEEMSSEGIDKRLTIEVDNANRNIVQARGKYNEVASASDKYWLNQWAKDAKLNISRYLI